MASRSQNSEFRSQESEVRILDSGFRIQESGLLTSLVGARYDDPRFDPPNCYGFVRYCYALAGIELPRDIRRNRRNITMVWPVSGAKNFLPVRANDYSPLPSPQYMDALYFRSSILQPRHIALALNQIWMIQSSEATNGVAIVRLDRPGIGNNLVAVYRHVGANNYSPLPPLRS